MSKTINDLNKSLAENITPDEIGAATSSDLDTVKNNIGTVSNLQTTDKTIVGAINELFQSANNGKQLIANAIGEPLSSEDTFSAMSTDINGLLSTFKTNMMNNGIAVESSDRFKSLIDKIATMVEEGSGKGIQFAEGTINNFSFSKNYQTLDFSADIGFIPTYFFVHCGYINDQYSGISLYNVAISNIKTTNISDISQIINTKLTLTNITETGFSILGSQGASNETMYSPSFYHVTWYAIGVGEEDNTLRDSLASILQEEGVSVTEEDDMASLISKVDSEFNDKNTEMSSLNTNITLLTNQVNSLTSELAGKVTPAGTAVASNVLTGKTFINNTGQTITGTMANNGTKTITPKASAQTLGAGYYDKITINGDANLVAANIVSGKNIFGVTGTAIKAPNVTAGSSYYLLRGVYVSGQHSVDYYGGYIKNGKIYSTQNYIWFRMYFPFSGTISIDYIYYFTDWYNQIKVYNKAGTLVNQTANEKVGNANTRLTHNLQVEAGGRIDICGYGVDYGTNGADTSTPDSNYLRDLNVKFSLS